MKNQAKKPKNRERKFVNEGCEDEMIIHGFKKKRCQEIVCTLLYFATFGLLKLLFDWYPVLMVRLKCRRCSLNEADYVKLVDQYHQHFVAEVYSQPIHLSSLTEENESRENCFNQNVTVEHKYFINKKVKYVWNADENIFERLRGLHYGKSCSYFHDCQGLLGVEQEERRTIFGPNSIRVHVTPVLKLLYTQGLNPFYMFQVFSCSLWFIDQYYYFAACIITLSIISLTAQIHQMRYSERKLKHTIGVSEEVSVFRRDTGEFEMTKSEDLVPGDIIEIQRTGCLMQCDAVLTNGVCIVNESMLTGESIPVTKTSVPDPHSQRSFKKNNEIVKDEIFKETDHCRHVLYCGTKVIQTRFYENQKVTAVVMHTGFLTSKGELVRSILFPKPVNFKFTQDSYKFIACLALIATIGMVYTLILMISRDESIMRIVVRTLDLVTIVIPPALPAAMTVGVVMAQKRLWESSIYCLNSKNINLCGAVDCFCFDKTGTLTEDGLDLKVIVPSVDGRFKNEVRDAKQLGNHSNIVIGMATCHSLTTINDEIVGDPMDLKMFETTDWVFDEAGAKFDTFIPTVVKPKISLNARGPDNKPELGPQDYGILRQFTFSSKLQRMSVVVRSLQASHYELYCKGSPEMMVSLSLPHSVPANFQEVLMNYTKQGYRVLALAHRNLKMSVVKIQRSQREQVERRMTFLGLIIFENQLKRQTRQVIHILNNANIRPIMVTGDNMLTALSVAKNCDMIGLRDRIIFITSLPSDSGDCFELHWARVNDDGSGHGNEYDEGVEMGSYNDIFHGAKVSYKDDNVHMAGLSRTGKIHLAITGKSWSLVRRYHPHFVNKLLEHGTVFSRFSPDQKQQLIESLIEIGHYVGMCGDGANDCGALKAAHAGISLSEAEASVASPFTSKQANIECVPNLIKEGRAALVTSFGIFKFMASYSLTQFTSVCLLYWVGANLTDLSFLYIDMFLLASLSFTFSRTRSYSILVPEPPRVSLLALSPILSILVQVFANLSFQLIIWFFTNQQPWFQPYYSLSPHIRNFSCHEVTAVFSVSAFQYITLAVVYSKGAPYRRTILTNYLFMFNIFLAILITCLIVIYPIRVDWFLSVAQLKPAPNLTFRLLLMSTAILNFFVCFALEMTLIDFWFDQGRGKYGFETPRNSNSNESPVIEETHIFLSDLKDVAQNSDLHTSNPQPADKTQNNETPEGIFNENLKAANHDTRRVSKKNNLMSWMSPKNEHQSLAKLIEAEQLVWDKLETLLPATDHVSGDAINISDDEDEGGVSRKSSMSSSLIRKLSETTHAEGDDNDKFSLIGSKV